MNRIVKLFLIFFSVFIFFLFPGRSFASDNSFITIVNPVRISTYIKTPAESLYAEYQEVKNRNLPATWLLTYDALSNPEIIKAVKSFDKNQEIGIFLEVSSQFSKNAGVIYNARDSWHRATSLFLTGYKQEDRKKLIDSVFEEFKNNLGHYPKSVGSWWTDSYSLEYISKKYHATSNLTVSDQFSLDGYSIWGTPYSVPFYPSKINAGYPAKNEADKIDMVMLRWAPRDPLNGYKSPSTNPAAMYSTQDYSTIGLNENYFKKISSFYAINQPPNKFSHLVVGLESDFNASTFSGEYAQRLNDIVALAQGDSAKILTAQDFSSWYISEFKGIFPPQLLVNDDFLESGKKAFWFQNENYRAGLVFDSKTKILSIVDLHSYYRDFEEPFYRDPNRQNYLYIIPPAIIDGAVPKTQKNLSCGDYMSADSRGLKFHNCQVNFLADKFEIEEKGIMIEDLGQKYEVAPQGFVFDEVGLRVPYTILRRVPAKIIDLAPFGILLLVLGFIVFVWRFSSKRRVGWVKFSLIAVLAIFFASYKSIYVSQSEFDALSYLKSLPSGNVLVFQKDCLKCTYEGKYMPAAMVGNKEYVGKLSHHHVIESLKLPVAKSPEDIKNEIRDKSATYIYLAKYEEYVEELPYPPEKANLKVIFENANAQILKVE